jgi:hypothetical protein
LGCRKVARVLEVLSEHFQQPVPHHTTIRQWVVRNGCYTLNSPLEQANDWVAIGDLTISLGKIKCLAVVGARTSNLEKRDDFKLTHQDIEVLGLYPTEKSNGNFVNEALKDSAKRVGGNFLATVIDQGSDIKKGAQLFQQEHSDVKILHDIAHKLSNVMEKTLKNDAIWAEYIKQLNMTRKRAYQTELAALMPAKQREKARFMDIGYLVNWPERLAESKVSGRMFSISDERYKDYFGWIDGFKHSLEEWGFMVGIVGMIRESVNTFGLSRGVYSCLKIFLDKAPIKGERLETFVLESLVTVWKEVEKLDEEETMISSTEVLESVFGKYKAINQGTQGITGNVLGICAFVGKKKGEQDIKMTMENCSVKKGFKWIKDKIGMSISSLRRQFFRGSNSTKVASEVKV